MNNIEMYTRPGCSYCISAKNLLNNRDLDFVEYNVAIESHRFNEMLVRSPQRTFPQIFIDGESVGGFEELASLDRAKKLNQTKRIDRTVKNDRTEKT